MLDQNDKEFVNANAYESLMDVKINRGERIKNINKKRNSAKFENIQYTLMAALVLSCLVAVMIAFFIIV